MATSWVLFPQPKVKVKMLNELREISHCLLREYWKD